MSFGMSTSTQKLEKKSKLCYMDTDTFIVYIKAKDITQTLQKMLKRDLIR